MRGRCDHDPRAPRLRLVVEPIPNQPWLCKEAAARSRRLYDEPRSFPELTGHAIVGRSMRLRERKSSRREAWALMAASIARHVDRRTLRIGDQRDDGLCNGVSLERYEEETGLSRWRISRTLREFEAAAFIVTKDQPVEALTDEDGRPILDEQGKQRHRGFAAIRVVTPLFFQRLGFTTEKLKKARRYASQQWAKKRAPAASAVAVLEGRRELRRLLRGNRKRNARLERGEAPTPSGSLPPQRLPDPVRLLERNALRERRLEALPPVVSKPPPKPPRST